ncbi:hypothetical protein [Variovorax sp. RCC_210]|uniref:hypothetical protein n=1 Tax=Variovorax sp. RCC_210 TaxID=3239217 RepID=UPI003523D069
MPSNRLIKQTNNVPVVKPVFVPAQPARTTLERRYVCGLRYSVPGSYTAVVDPATGGATLQFTPNEPIKNGSVQGVWACSDESVRVQYPAVPAHYEDRLTTDADFNLGWNSGGRSKDVIFGDGWAEFKASGSAVGIICGLNSDDGTQEYRGNLIDFAFYLFRGQALIMENGVVKGSAGAYTSASVFRIERSGSSVAYKVNGATKYTNAAAGTAPVWLEAAMYSAYDEVFDPVMTQVGALPTSNNMTMNVVLPSLAEYFMSGVSAILECALPPLRPNLLAGFVAPSFTVMEIDLPQLQPSLDLLVGNLAQMAVQLPSLKALYADHPYAEMDVRLAPLGLSLQALEGNFNATLGAATQASSSMKASTLLVVFMSSNAQVAGAMTVQSVQDARMDSSAVLDSVMGIEAMQEALMASVASSAAMLGVPAGEMQTLVVNLEGFGNTSYSAFDFNSFARLGDRYLGAGESGIVDLDGATDNGAPIAAHVHFGKRDLGNAQRKTVAECYVGMAGEDKLILRVTAEGRTFDYRTRSHSDVLQQQRVDIGKGLKANYFELELFNQDGADFEIDTVQLQVADLQRKI